MAELVYFIEDPTPRAQYALNHFLARVLGWKVERAKDLETVRSSSIPCLVYGHRGSKGAIQVHPQGLLAGDHARPDARKLVGGDAPPMPFPLAPGDHFFDPFAATFWLLSRIEEHNGIERDEHGRPRTDHLHASSHGFLDHPVVDEWAMVLAEQWRKANTRIPPARRTYAHLAALDVDNGFKFLGRPAWRTLGAAARDVLRGDMRNLKDRIQVLLGAQRDPYDIYDDFCELSEGARRMAFVLVAMRGRYDHAVGLGYEPMLKRLKTLAERAEIGLHPSYASSDLPGTITGERSTLANALGRPVLSSRQHFLRLRAPGTFRELEEIGIEEEHSMGLADEIGFRAGTCTPYPFYDIEQERESPLMVHPFAVMDSAMCYKMRLSPSEAIRRAKTLVDRVKQVKGTFSAIWHERFLSDHGDEAGWRRVAEEVLRYARP